MTIRLRFEDFDASGERVSLGGRIVRARDILSVAVQKRVSAASLGYSLIGGLLVLASLKAATMVSVLICLGLATVCGVGALHEWRHPYVLVLDLYQVGKFEVYGIPAAALPALQDYLESL